MFCDVTHPDGTPLDSDTRGLLKKAVAQAAQEGYAFAFGSEMEFYLFQTDEAGNPTTQPYDPVSYTHLDVYKRQVQASALWGIRNLISVRPLTV